VEGERRGRREAWKERGVEGERRGRREAWKERGVEDGGKPRLYTTM